MNFDYDADPYFVREQAFERIADAQVPQGVRPGISPLFSPSGLIYRYVLQSPDKTPQELKIIRRLGSGSALPVDPGRCRRFRLRRHDNAVPGAARSEQTVRLWLDGSADRDQQLSSNNANAGGGFYSQGGQFYYIRGLGLVKDTDDIGNIVVSAQERHPDLRQRHCPGRRSATRRGSASSVTWGSRRRWKA